MSKKLKAVIPAGGMGTRTLPATKVFPKELLPLGDRPVIQIILEEIVEAGISEVAVVISRGKEMILQHFQNDPLLEDYLAKKGKLHLLDSVEALRRKVKFTAVYQESPHGLGHAVLCARDFVGKSDFVVLLPDDIIVGSRGCTSQMAALHAARRGRGVVALEKVPWERVEGYGIVAGKAAGPKVYALSGLVEKPRRDLAPSNLSVVGRYILTPEVFEILGHQPPGANGEIQLTDALDALAQRGKFFGYEFSGERFDLGTSAGFLWANLRYVQRSAGLCREIENNFGKLPFRPAKK